MLSFLASALKVKFCPIDFRRVLRYCFIHLSNFEWKSELVSEFCDLVEKQVVSANSLARKKKPKKKKKHLQDQESQVRILDR
jgi:hypothetical protein